MYIHIYYLSTATLTEEVSESTVANDDGGPVQVYKHRNGEEKDTNTIQTYTETKTDRDILTARSLIKAVMYRRYKNPLMCALICSLTLSLP